MSMSFLYALFKDLKEHLSWTAEDRLVNMVFFKESGIAQELKDQGFIERWTLPSNVEQLKLKEFGGYDVVYQLDRPKKIRYRLVLEDGAVLMGKKSEAGPEGAALS